MKLSGGTFDFVIIGAGSAGSILADRLTQDGTTTACVLEAGPWDKNPLIHIPAGFVKLNTHADLTWPFASEPTELTAGRSIRLPQGKVVGGSSSINGMIYNRGQREDFDAWAEQGNPGWSFDDVLPYFKRSERRIGAGDDEFRGRNGSLPVTNHDWHDPVCERFIDGLQELGIGRNPDYNGRQQEGAGYFQRLILNGRRVSAARAFLHPARRRQNLEVRTNVRVTRVLIEDGRVVGVEYSNERAPAIRTTVAVTREVVICAGTINTTQILQLSGIGPGAALQDLGVSVVRDLAGVGESLRDHYAVRIVAAAKNAGTINKSARGLRLGREIARWLIGKPSILALPPSLVHIFTRSPYATSRPDLQFVFTPGSYRAGKVYSLDRYPGMTCGFCQQRPESSGYVRLRSTDPFDSPIVQPNYLASPLDQQIVVAGLKMVRGFLNTKTFAHYFDRETLPGAAARSDEDLLDYARHYGITSFHFVGTAKMGPSTDPNAVVDSKLRVHGVTGLRVADASVMPMITSANTYAATLMIAERAADFIRGTVVEAIVSRSPSAT